MKGTKYLTLLCLFIGNALFAASDIPGYLPLDNPFSYETGINDCDVIKFNGEYYITGNWLGGDMFQSRNLTEWGQRTHIFSPNNTWHQQKHPILDQDTHGTHIAYDNGTFHLYAHLQSDGLLGCVHATSNSVTGPYYELLDEPFVTNTIDIKTFKDEDGSLHYYSTRFGGVSGNHNDYRSMSDYSTFTSDYINQIWPTCGWEINPEKDEFVQSVPTINEGPFVFKYHDKYYMIYNANHTGDTSYALGCAVADEPDGFSNSGKQPEPVLGKTEYTSDDGTYNIYTLGQPWVVEGLNGFERWIGYFAIDGAETSYGRTQRIDRVHFFDTELYVDGPSNRHMPGYRPRPAEPQLRSLFYLPDGPMPASDWTETSPNNIHGQWQVKDDQAYQADQSCFSFNLVNRDPASHYLFEANMQMPEVQDQEDKAGVVAYYKDENNWMLIGVDRSGQSGSDNWYCHVKTDTTNGIIATGKFNGSFDYSVYHKIKLDKNSSYFKVWIDDVLLDSLADIDTGLTEPGVPGLFADHVAANYDGIIYTIGWDEYDSNTKGWGDSLCGITQNGSWSYAYNGIRVSTGGRTFKGDYMNTYEFSTQIYRNGSSQKYMGVFAAITDANNFVRAYFDLTTNKLIVNGRIDGQAFTELSADVEDKNDYNLRSVKLKDRIIFFVDGKETLTLSASLPASQIGLFADSMYARYNGIMVYRTDSDALDVQWKSSDVGTVGFEGTAQSNDGTFTVTGSGSDIWLGQDGCHMAYQDLYGTGSIVARLINNDITNSWDKAAVMVRDSLDGGSPMAAVVYCGNGRIQFLWREQQDQNAKGVTATGYPFELTVWLGLAVNNNTYTGYYSYDGENWTSIGSADISFANDHIKAGLAVTSHDNNRINAAVFDNVSIKGCTPGDFLADLNNDCQINIDDLSTFAANWLSPTTTSSQLDFDYSNTIDLADYAILANNWLISYDN